jgi:hypothetical protein
MVDATNEVEVVSEKEALLRRDFAGLTEDEQTVVDEIKKGHTEYEAIEAQQIQNTITIGHYFFDLHAITKRDRYRYKVELDGKTQYVGRFMAVVVAMKMPKMTAYRYLRAYEQNLKDTVKLPQSLTDRAATFEIFKPYVLGGPYQNLPDAEANGVFNTEEDVKDHEVFVQRVLAESFLKFGQPTTPTPEQLEVIMGDALARTIELKPQESQSADETEEEDTEEQDAEEVSADPSTIFQKMVDDAFVYAAKNAVSTNFVVNAWKAAMERNKHIKTRPSTKIKGAVEYLDENGNPTGMWSADL